MTNEESDADSGNAPDLKAGSTSELADIVGADLLAFMLALNPGDIRKADVLDNDRMKVADSVWAQVMRHSEPIETPSRISWKALPEALLIDVFCAYDDTVGSSLATDCHMRSGGHGPTIEDSISMDGCVQTIAVDCFAARIVGNGQSLHTPSVVQAHPLMQTVRKRLRDDSEPVTKLLRDAFDATDIADRRGRVKVSYSDQMEVYWSTGGGGSLSLRDIGANIICGVVLGEDLDDHILVRVAAAVRDNLGRARRLAVGEPVLVTTLVGLGEVKLADDIAPIEIVGGRLRRPNALDRRVNSFAAQPDAILEVDRPLRFIDARLSPSPNPDSTEFLKRFVADTERRNEFLPELLKSADSLEETIRRVRFAMVLASPADGVFNPRWLFSREFNPLTLSGSNSHQPNPSPGLVTTTPAPSVDASSAAEIADWDTKMDKLPDSLKVGRRRLLQATTERPDPFDQFIDAVIAWESMFGAKGETTFRVTGSMALLLETADIEARKVLHKQLNDLYSRRSDLVHGAFGLDRESRAFKVAEVPDHARAAVRFAIECFKKILDDPALFPLDSTERSKRILLGF